MAERTTVYFSAVVAVAVAVAVAVVWVAGAAPYWALGVADPGVVVRLGTVVLRVMADGSATICVGSVAFAVIFTGPCGPDRRVSVEGYRAMRSAALWAWLWSGAALAMVSFTAASDAGVPLPVMSSPYRWWGLVDAQEEPRTWLVMAGLATVVGLSARAVLAWRSVVGLLLVALLALLPPLAAGHSSSDTGHDVATEAIAVHVLAVTVWTGLLIRLVVRWRWLGRALSPMLARYSRVSMVCWLLVAASGVADAVVLLGDRAGLGSGYGRLLAAKAAVLIVIGFGLVACSRRTGRHREQPRSWWLLAELFVLAATAGMSWGLPQLFPPAFGQAVTIPQTLLGYTLAGPPSVATLVRGWRPEVLWIGLVGGLAAGYAIALRRLRPADACWPRWRTACWMMGCAVLLAATCSGIGRYEPAMFSMHMLSHMLEGVLAPGLLVQGAPLSLAIASARPGDAGLSTATDWVKAMMESRCIRWVTHPLVALVMFAGAPYVIYFSSVFDAVARFHWAHMLLAAFFLVVGYLFAWSTIGVDQAPSPLPDMARLGMLLAAGPCTAVFAAWVVTTNRLLGDGPAGYNAYSSLHLPWVVDLRGDQWLGGVIALAVGETALLGALVVLLARWHPWAAAPGPGDFGRRPRGQSPAEGSPEPCTELLARVCPD